MSTTLSTSAPVHLWPHPGLWRNTAWNLCGTVLPMSIGLIVLPRLIEQLGPGRFGLLTIAWTLVGYLSLFDFGMGRSVTKLIAERLGSGDTLGLSRLWSGSIVLIAAQGLAGGALLALLVPWLTSTVLKIPPGLQAEARLSLYLLAPIVPIVTSSASLRGFLEAHGDFRSINAVKICLGVSLLVGPLLAVQISPNVSLAILTLLVARLVAWFAYFALCIRISNCGFEFRFLSRQELKTILRLGGWMTVSNLVSPIMTSLDTFLIGALLSVSEIQFYSVPVDLVNKGLLVPSSLAVVLFPVFSSMYSRDRRSTEEIYRRSIRILIVFLAPFAIGCALLAKPGLTLWLGSAFAERSYHVAQVIALGVFMNGIASVPFALLQASGRPDITAKLHLIELPLYVLAVFLLTQRMGIVGAAIAWTGRVTLDSMLLLTLSSIRPGLGLKR